MIRCTTQFASTTCALVDDADNLRADLEAGKSIAIVGGGVIGLEVAMAARAMGCMVTLIRGS
ncbi:FAD-dependent oxidoreductase [Cupriavidus basilensis]